MIDVHSHILPAIDDGARNMEEALEMARLATQDGIEFMVSTPHMFNGLSTNPAPSEIAARVDALNEAIGADGVRVLPGNEVHLTHDIVEHAINGRFTKINQRNYMLVEFPQLTIPVGASELFQRLLAQDARPILVHPERNAQIQMNPSIVAKFVQSGILIQVTAMSVTGEFGPAAKSCADKLLQHDCVHFLATDAHRAKSRPPILSKGRAAAARMIGEERASALVEANPLAVIKGEPVNVRPPISFQSSAQPKRWFFSRFFS